MFSLTLVIVVVVVVVIVIVVVCSLCLLPRLLLLFVPYVYRGGCCGCLIPMSTDAAAVVHVFRHLFLILFH